MRGQFLTPDVPAPGFICRSLKIPNSVGFLAIVSGALAELSKEHNFEDFGALSPAETAAYFQQMYDDYAESRGCMIGTIFAHALATAPVGSLPCDGVTFLRVDYPDLYVALDPVYVVDADNARTPDLRSRSVIGTGQGAGLSNRALDQAVGTETHQLTTDEMPSHTHQYTASTVFPGAAPGTPQLIVISQQNVPTTNTGGGQAHNNMQPFYVLNYGVIAS